MFQVQAFDINVGLLKIVFHQVSSKMQLSDLTADKKAIQPLIMEVVLFIGVGSLSMAMHLPLGSFIYLPLDSLFLIQRQSECQFNFTVPFNYSLA